MPRVLLAVAVVLAGIFASQMLMGWAGLSEGLSMVLSVPVAIGISKVAVKVARAGQKTKAASGGQQGKHTGGWASTSTIHKRNAVGNTFNSHMLNTAAHQQQLAAQRHAHLQGQRLSQQQHSAQAQQIINQAMNQAQQQASQTQQQIHRAHQQAPHYVNFWNSLNAARNYARQGTSSSSSSANKVPPISASYMPYEDAVQFCAPVDPGGVRIHKGNRVVTNGTYAHLYRHVQGISGGHNSSFKHIGIASHDADPGETVLTKLSRMDAMNLGLASCWSPTVSGFPPQWTRQAPKQPKPQPASQGQGVPLGRAYNIGNYTAGEELDVGDLVGVDANGNVVVHDPGVSTFVGVAAQAGNPGDVVQVVLSGPTPASATYATYATYVNMSTQPITYTYATHTAPAYSQWQGTTVAPNYPGYTSWNVVDVPKPPPKPKKKDPNEWYKKRMKEYEDSQELEVLEQVIIRRSTEDKFSDDDFKRYDLYCKLKDRAASTEFDGERSACLVKARKVAEELARA